MKSKDYNVILVTFDALRADVAGDERLAPNLHGVAREGVKFENAFTHAPYTWAAFGSLFTAKYPSEACYKNGVLREIATLAEAFKKAGYTTAGIHSNPFLTGAHGFDRGFDYFDSSLVPLRFNARNSKAAPIISKFYRVFRKQPYLDGKELNKKAEKWIENASLPFFLWALYMDTHGPYQSKRGLGYLNKIRGELLYHRAKKKPGSITEEEKEKLLSWYREEVGYGDEKLGELLEFLKQRDIYDSSIIVVTSDHGDTFREHGRFCHPRQLYDELIRVPLIIRHPEIEGGKITTPVGLVDVMPTLIDMLGVESNSRLHGESLLPLMRRIYGKNRGFVVSDATPDEEEEHVAVRTEKWKLIVNGKEKELYNMEEDPGEKVNVYQDEKEVAKRLEGLLVENHPERRESTKGPEPVLDSEVKKRLEDLGYY